MRNSDYYLPSIVLALALAAKLPGLRRGWRDPLVRSVHFVLFTATSCFVLAAPATIALINRLTGTPNIAAPLVYCFLCAFSCTCLVLIAYWRGGPPSRVRRVTRGWMAAYGTVIALLPVLFALGEAPVERLRDFDTYYADTPYLREMIVLYLLAHTVAAAVTTLMCLLWARAVGQWLRVGLCLLVAGFFFNLSFGLAKLTAIGARWAGGNWDALSTTAAPLLASAGGLTTAIGFLVPLLAPRFTAALHAGLTYTRLGALWHWLSRAQPGAEPPRRPRIPWWAAPELRLTVRETVIHDELLRLQPYLDDRVRRRAYASAVVGYAPRRYARAVGVAAMVVTAVEARREGQPPGEGTDPAQSGVHALTAALSPGREGLVRLSQILRSPYVTDAVRKEAAAGSAMPSPAPGERAPSADGGAPRRATLRPGPIPSPTYECAPGVIGRRLCRARCRQGITWMSYRVRCAVQPCALEDPPIDPV
ncbi:MAB_1171c family putative transporter [Streptomyces sp. NPDC005963]|uniref:MAB_1171c family putative transporter n=1 Tax=Streptomyces sp. NPDC005963 TaxID=3156721 RepID=UPI0033C74849